MMKQVLVLLTVLFSATFSYQSNIAKKILKNKKCNVQFFERDTGFNFAVSVSKLKKTDSNWSYTFWHNKFFNPELNEELDILYFCPDKSELIKKD